MDDVCVITQPLGDSDPTATADLLAILSNITSVSVIAIALANDSELRNDFDVIEVSHQQMGSSVLVAAWRFIRNQVKMALQIRQRPESVAWFFGSQAYVIPILVAKLSGKTVVMQPRANVSLSLFHKWRRRLPNFAAVILSTIIHIMEHSGYRLSDGIVTYTPGMANELGLHRYEEKLFTDGARFVDIDKFAPKVPYAERKPVVGFLGRLVDEKGIQTLADVSKELPCEIIFVFAGDGELRGWLEDELASELESGKVEITGWVPHEDVPQMLNRFKLLVLTSEPTEGLPTVILEAMACGTPVYARPVSGIPDVVRAGETGILMENRTPTDVSNTIISFINSGDSSLSRSARNRVEEQYSFDSAVERYEQILRGLSN